MADGGVFVHRCAQDAHEQITRLFDFMSPTIVAMWNLRWQVQGFLTAVPGATQQDIVKRFALGSGVRGNEILRACREVSWDDQRHRFSAIILTNTIAIFEDFTEQITSLTLPDAAARAANKDLQFPANPSGTKGYLAAYSALGGPIPELAGVFTSATTAGRWYSGPTLQNLLLCYRFFKEIRNALAHGGGKAGPRLMVAYAGFSPVATPTLLGMDRVPAHVPPVLDNPITLDPEGVNWFCNVVLRLIATIDADLSDKATAFVDVEAHLPTTPKSERSPIADLAKRERKMAKLALRGRFPPSSLTPAYVAFLKRTDRIPSYW